jgi:hypothetical protein
MTFDFRYLFMLLGTGLAFLIWKDRRVDWIELRPRAVFGFSALVFFGIALTAKYLQLVGNKLHGQDFWLFVDALDTASKGGAWLTRFAPQSVGWVQHGAVHAFLPMSLFVPLVWVVGAKWTAQLINPVALSFAGYLLALLARPRWGVLGSLGWMLGFYALSANGKTLMYEVHPEALYPAFFFATLLSLRSSPSRSRFLLPSLVCLFSLKLDALGLVVPVAMVCAAAGESWRRVGLGILLGILVQVLALRGFAQGWFGPQEWAGAVPVIPAAGGLGVSLGGGTSLLAFFSDWGGRVWDQLYITLRFIFSRPLLSLVIPFFWVLSSAQWWFGAIGLGFLYSWVPGALPLWNYYSAIWVALIVGLAVGFPARKKWIVTMVVLSTFLGGGSPKWHFESADARQNRLVTESEVHSALECIKSRRTSSRLQGVVGPGLILFFWDHGRDFFLTDRWQKTSSSDTDQIRFVILERGVDRYLMTAREVEAIEAELKKNPAWVEVGRNCTRGTMRKVTFWLLTEVMQDEA